MMTHVVWAPPQWAAAARKTLAGLEERHPSRTILLVPEPRRGGRDRRRRLVALLRDRGRRRARCAREVIELRLRRRARRGIPASVVLPLLISDLPTFCRWRGEPPWGEPELEQLVDVCDRLVVDSAEWRGLPGATRGSRSSSTGSPSPTSRWRGRSAGAAGSRRCGPRSADREALRDRAAGRRAPARRLAALAAAASRCSSTHRAAAELERVAVDGEPVAPPRGGPPSAERPALGRARPVRPRPGLRGRGQRSSLRSRRPFDETGSRSARRPPRR